MSNAAMAKNYRLTITVRSNVHPQLDAEATFTLPEVPESAGENNPALKSVFADFEEMIRDLEE